MTPTNLVNQIADQAFVKAYGISEAFFFQGEFYVTSNYEISFENKLELRNELEKFAEIN